MSLPDPSPRSPLPDLGTGRGWATRLAPLGLLLAGVILAGSVASGRLKAEEPAPVAVPHTPLFWFDHARGLCKSSWPASGDRVEGCSADCVGASRWSNGALGDPNCIRAANFRAVCGSVEVTLSPPTDTTRSTTLSIGGKELEARPGNAFVTSSILFAYVDVVGLSDSLPYAATASARSLDGPTDNPAGVVQMSARDRVRFWAPTAAVLELCLDRREHASGGQLMISHLGASPTAAIADEDWHKFEDGSAMASWSPPEAGVYVVDTPIESFFALVSTGQVRGATIGGSSVTLPLVLEGRHEVVVWKVRIVRQMDSRGRGKIADYRVEGTARQTIDVKRGKQSTAKFDARTLKMPR